MLDKKHGFGVYHFSNDYIYKGNYVEDVRSGQGQLFFEDQLLYDGEWLNGEKVEDTYKLPKKSRRTPEKMNKLSSSIFRSTDV